jgi:hypothetical protein
MLTKPLGGELVQQAAGHVRRFVKAGVAHGVGQAGIGVAADEGVARHLGQLLDVRAHEGRAQSAVQAHRQRLGVAHAVPKRGDGLAAQDAPRSVGDGAADDEGQAHTTGVKVFVDGKQGGLGVQGIEDGFDQQHIDAAFDQGLHLLVIGHPQLFKVDVTSAGVVHIGADAGGFGGGAQGAHRIAGFVGGGELVACGAGNAGRGTVHLHRQIGHVVIGLGDGGGAKGVGLDQIGTGGQIALVDVADDVRAGETEQLVIAFDVAVKVGETLALAALAAEARPPVLGLGELKSLDHGAHGTVQNDDTLRKDVRQGLGVGVMRVTHGQDSRSLPWLESTSLYWSNFMSDMHNHDGEEQDVVESIVPLMPIVLPIGGGILIFLLAFIAVFMA